MASASYIPPVDGLRAVAILLVLAFHYKLPCASLGWCGVWLFFVISGFLITGILLDTKSDPRYYQNFYIRRTLRIFPIYYVGLVVLLMATSCQAWFARIGATEAHYGLRDWPWFVVYLQNYCLGFEQFAPRFPPHFDHTWSLAVEEQFYLVWPFVVRRVAAARLIQLCVVLIAAAPISRVILAGCTGNASLVFTPLICNVDALAMGALLACLARQPAGQALLQQPTARYRLLVRLGALTLLIIIGAMVAYYGPGAYWKAEGYLTGLTFNLILTTLLSGLASLVLVEAVFLGRLLGSVLSLGVLRHIGKISYGVYLYHWPLLLVVPRLLEKAGLSRQRQPLLISAICLMATYGLSLASWHLLEKRCLDLKEKFAARTGNGERRVRKPPGK